MTHNLFTAESNGREVTVALFGPDMIFTKALHPSHLTNITPVDIYNPATQKVVDIGAVVIEGFSANDIRDALIHGDYAQSWPSVIAGVIPQLEKQSPPKPPTQIPEPKEFGAIVEAHTQYDSARRKYVYDGGYWISNDPKQLGQGTKWHDLINPTLIRDGVK